MAYPFLKAQGATVGKSLCLESDVELAKKILKADLGKKILLPIDHVVEEEKKTTTSATISEGACAYDIGPKTIKRFADAIATGKTIFWNGPMGFFENPTYAVGTLAMAKALASSKGFTLVGGGDSVSAVMKSGLADKISHISTGGGASLEFIENGGQLPGISALKYGIN